MRASVVNGWTACWRRSGPYNIMYHTNTTIVHGQHAYIYNTRSITFIEAIVIIVCVCVHPKLPEECGRLRSASPARGCHPIVTTTRARTAAGPALRTDRSAQNNDVGISRVVRSFVGCSKRYHHTIHNRFSLKSRRKHFFS